MHATRIVAGLALWMASAAALAAPCAGFADVENAGPFCPSVEWLKNRQVILGCAPASYCPNGKVSRLQMAALLNRLSTALAPVVLTTTESGIASTINSGYGMCWTGPYLGDRLPHVVTVNATVYYKAPTVESLGLQLSIYTWGEEVWPIAYQGTGAPNPPNGYASQTVVSEPLVLDQAGWYQIGLNGAGFPRSSLLDDAGCTLSVRLDPLTLPPPALNEPPRK